MTTKIEIIGPQKVDGSVHISGAKNAALPLLAASILTESGLKLDNVPLLRDIGTMLSLLEELGATFVAKEEDFDSRSIYLKTDSVHNFVAPYEIVKQMRASILILGPMLARFGKCSVSLPGGCAIGVRPIDLHIKGMQALGAKIDLKDGYVHASALRGLRGAEIDFPIVTVTGTENVMIAATLAEGTTVLKNAAREPEIVDLAECLNKMGAKISGQGTSTIVIEGVTSLHEAEHTVIADRIEAGTYALVAGITGGSVDLMGGDFRSLLGAFIEKVEQTGLIFEDIVRDNAREGRGGQDRKVAEGRTIEGKRVQEGKIVEGLRVRSSGHIAPVNVETEPYPGFPTDLQAQTMAMLCLADGESHIQENIWENRFMHVAELARMGADIEIHSGQARIKGVKRLKGAPVMATDLRASFSLVLAALAAEGKTVIDRVYHLDRGYGCVEKKLAGCGVRIDRIY